MSDDRGRPSTAEVLEAFRDVYAALRNAALATRDRPENIQQALDNAFPILRAYGVAVARPDPP